MGQFWILRRSCDLADSVALHESVLSLRWIKVHHLAVDVTLTNGVVVGFVFNLDDDRGKLLHVASNKSAITPITGQRGGGDQPDRSVTGRRRRWLEGQWLWQIGRPVSRCDVFMARLVPRLEPRQSHTWWTELAPHCSLSGRHACLIQLLYRQRLAAAIRVRVLRNDAWLRLSHTACWRPNVWPRIVTDWTFLKSQ